MFLSLKNALAYEDFIIKTFGFKCFNLLCTVLFPEFKLSMRTGNVEDDEKVVNVANYSLDGDFVARLEIPLSFAAQYASVFDEELMEKEDKEHDEIYAEEEGSLERRFAHDQTNDPW